MINASIEVNEFADEIFECITPDLDEVMKRSTLKVSKNDGVITFNIEAQDIVAFRATTNAVMQLLNVFYKVKEIK